MLGTVGKWNSLLKLNVLRVLLVYGSLQKKIKYAGTGTGLDFFYDKGRQVARATYQEKNDGN